MKKLLILLSCAATLSAHGQEIEKNAITKVLDSWHGAAATANFDSYFNLMAPEAVFIGTDAAEVWTKQEFMNFSKPYFDAGKAWEFKAVQRNIYFSQDGNMAWFDELLDTWMQLCRGSGVLIRTPEGWRIAHYVLSLTIPNDQIQPVIDLKKDIDGAFLKALIEE